MTRVTFIRHGMEVEAVDIRNMSHKLGDPLPVNLIDAAQAEWAKRMGHDPISQMVKPGSHWEKVRVGAETFTYRQFTDAQSNPAQQAQAAPEKPLDNKPKILPAPDSVPSSWGLLDDIKADFGTAKTSAPSKEHGPVINAHGEIDYHKTQDRNLQRDLAKLGAKPRMPKNDG